MNRTWTIIMLVLPACLCSCATILPETSPNHQAISAVIRAHVQNLNATIEGPIRIKIKGERAIACYTMMYRMAQQPWDPRESTLVNRDGAWVLKQSRSTKPWYYRYK
ncbi:MAG: hypothetical protein A3K19_33855 [Lentisphaerae bacterium RIFOXYB12_FULL_65_16]|nr:MAG: hypothetical protein A3K19_33855 [Lentisphaerae bacterium RIFOXYB12_FULL_65_16]